MGAFRTYFMLLFVLAACTACADVRTVKLVSNSIEEPEIEYDGGMTVNSTKNLTNSYIDDNYSDPFNHSQLPTSKYNEKKRYRLYGTLMNLDNLTIDNCVGVIRDIKESIWDVEDDIEDAEDDVRDAEEYVEVQYRQKEEAVEGGNPYEIAAENDDINDAEYWLWEEKEKLKSAERHNEELNKTLAAVEEECRRLGYEE